MFYDRFIELCQAKGVKPGRACIDMGVSRSLAAKWKATGCDRISDTCSRNVTRIKRA